MPPIYCIHDHPTDLPDYFVITKWDVSGVLTPEPARLGVFGFAETLELARQWMMSMGLVKMVRADADDFKIVETWL